MMDNDTLFALALALSKKGGGGGSSSLEGLDDVSITSPQGGECLKYNALTQKWENGDDAGNVQSDWNESDPTSGAYILNKPTIPDIKKLPAQTLSAGSTQVVFTDDSIVADSWIDVATSSGVWYSNAVIDGTNHTCTLTFPVQTSNITVEIKVS